MILPHGFFLKKSLPNAVIPGIPRLRARTIGLLSIGNHFTLCYFQRSCSRTGIGSINTGRGEPR